MHQTVNSKEFQEMFWLPLIYALEMYRILMNRMEHKNIWRIAVHLLSSVECYNFANQYM
jgi:hypothetical protein